MRSVWPRILLYTLSWNWGQPYSSLNSAKMSWKSEVTLKIVTEIYVFNVNRMPNGILNENSKLNLPHMWFVVYRFVRSCQIENLSCIFSSFLKPRNFRFTCRIQKRPQIKIRQMTRVICQKDNSSQTEGGIHKLCQQLSFWYSTKT